MPEPIAMTTFYQEKKQFFDNLLTVYGRKPVLEVLQDSSIPVFRLHLADTNQSGGILADIEKLASLRGIDIRYHSRDELSRISKNRRQDQGVAIDLNCPGYQHYKDFLRDQSQSSFRLIALDKITNPQNLGMILRSVSASPLDGILLPTKGSAPLCPLVIKASAGTLFKCRILRCDKLDDALSAFAETGTDICVLSGSADTSINDYHPRRSVIYVLGNETQGVSPEVSKLANTRLRIPMNNGVESLNVAVTAALIAFRGLI
jgi:23S rRNA (guanosine2251-2'-O)-methyltransferase